MEPHALKRIWTECFGNEEGWIDAFLHTAYDPQHVRMLTRQGKPAAALSWMDVFCQGRKLAYLYAICTAAEYRGQGLCRNLMVGTHSNLAAMGYAGTILVPADAGLHQMYAGMGYADFAGTREFQVEAGAPIPVQRITPGEYAALRRTFLPADGVVQEHGAPEYLAEFADLYAGDDFLLAAVPEDSRLRGLELLGNPLAANGILGALGYGRGIFRMPGKDRFAMFCPLLPDSWQPGYFGLAFE